MHLNVGLQDGHVVHRLAIFQVFWMSGLHHDWLAWESLQNC